MLPIDVIDENENEGSSMYESETDSEDVLDVTDSVINEESKEMSATIVSHDNKTNSDGDNSLEQIIVVTPAHKFMN